MFIFKTAAQFHSKEVENGSSNTRCTIMVVSWGLSLGFCKLSVDFCQLFSFLLFLA